MFPIHSFFFFREICSTYYGNNLGEEIIVALILSHGSFCGRPISFLIFFHLLKQQLFTLGSFFHHLQNQPIAPS